MRMIHPAFEHIVGQNNAKQLLSLSVNSFGNEKELIQPLILGEAGLGKTEIARSYAKALAQEMQVDYIEYATPKDFRLITDFDPFLDRLINDEKFIIYIDECHEIDVKMPSHAKFLAYLRKALDRQNDGKTFQVADRVTSYDRKNKVFILSTNHPNKVDDALKSRMNVLSLPLYNMKELKQITQLILEKNNLECDCEQTLNRISSCGRGTARPIVNLVRDVFNLMNISVIHNEIAMQGLRLLDMYPAGLNANEVRVLDLCKDKSLSKMQVSSAISGLTGVFSKSVAYLIQRGLMEAGSGVYTTTEKGKKYLEYLKKENFIWEL